MFEELLGPSLLTRNGTLKSTSALLNAPEFVLLYFSASWCGPCRHFTPQLKQFYNYVNSNGHNVEIIFVSLDRSIEAFHQYYSVMPWLSIPLQSQNVIRHLSSSFWVNTIPSLIVLTGDELYVTNNAKSDISNIISSRGDPEIVLESWRNIQQVPINEAYLGAIHFIYSSFKNGYNYLMGYSEDSTTGLINDDQAHRKDKQRLIPSKILFTFFEKVITQFDVYPDTKVCEKLLICYEDKEGSEAASSLANDDDDNDERSRTIPVSLETQRQFLLHVQMKALKDAVAEYNSSLTSCTADGVCKIEGDNNDTITVEEVQGCLKLVGCHDFTMVDCDSETSDEILKLMTVMNNSARVAFARSVLWSEVNWSKQYECGDGDNLICDSAKIYKVHRNLQGKSEGGESLIKEIQMDRAKILEYCGLCNTAFTKLPEVQTYISQGKEMFPSDLNNDSTGRNDIHTSSRTSQQRIVNVQNMILCAVGYDPSVGEKIYTQIIEMQQNNDKDYDEDFNKVLSSYMTNLQNLTKTDEKLS
mmetsp:Transcript_15914/g.23932  ORF Transcript_15914/g.23932 Transcript_15914/m.23932 type:complete len:529 (+) Transcript_15914:68-1654(+)